MKRFIWNIRVALKFWTFARLPLRTGYGIAAQDDDSFNDDLSPAEVVDNEVSYWGDQ